MPVSPADRKFYEDEAPSPMSSPFGHKYSWKLFRKSWTLSPPLPSFLRRWLKQSDAKFSFGFWCRLTVDKYVPKPPLAAPTVDPYEPIGSRQFRLIKLLRGDRSEPVRVQLITCDIDSDVQFEALSYVWGRDMAPTTISILGQHSTMTLQITHNLDAALRRLRLEDADRMIWADAICINQFDVLERSHQVALMGSIFKKADRVVIWLGDDTEGTSKGFELLRHFINPAGLKSQSPAYYTTSSPRTFASPLTSMERFGEFRYNKDMKQSMRCLLSKSWFFRVWTVPEAVLSRRARLQCGDNFAEWTNNFQELRRIRVRVKSAVVSPQWNHIFDDRGFDLTPFLDVIEAQIREVALQNGDPIPEKDLLDIMYDFRNRQASDPRDKIYAMLGLAQSKRVQVRVAPDYTLTVEEVYAQLDKALEELYGDLGLQDGI